MQNSAEEVKVDSRESTKIQCANADMLNRKEFWNVFFQFSMSVDVFHLLHSIPPQKSNISFKSQNPLQENRLLQTGVNQKCNEFFLKSFDSPTGISENRLRWSVRQATKPLRLCVTSWMSKFVHFLAEKKTKFSTLKHLPSCTLNYERVINISPQGHLLFDSNI